MQCKVKRRPVEGGVSVCDRSRSGSVDGEGERVPGAIRHHRGVTVRILGGDGELLVGHGHALPGRIEVVEEHGVAGQEHLRRPDDLRHRHAGAPQGGQHERYGMRRRERTGTAERALLVLLGMRRRVGTEEELRVAAEHRPQQCVAIFGTLVHRFAVRVHIRLVAEHHVERVEEVMGGDGRDDAGTQPADERDRFCRGDVLEHDAKLRQRLREPLHLVEEVRLAIEHEGIRHLAVEVEHHAHRLHLAKYREHRLEVAHPEYVGDALVARGRALRVELCRPNAECCCGPDHLWRRSVVEHHARNQAAGVACRADDVERSARVLHRLLAVDKRRDVGHQQKVRTVPAAVRQDVAGAFECANVCVRIDDVTQFSDDSHGASSFWVSRTGTTTLSPLGTLVHRR